MPATPAGYSEVTDLLLGDLIISASVDKQKFVNDAAEEMDAKIGWRYETPIPMTGTGAPPRHQLLLLKSINNKLASGRLILTLDVAGEGTTLHAYGYFLIKEATQELLLIANGDIELTGVTLTELEDAAGLDARSIGIAQYDDMSLLSGFEESVMRGATAKPHVRPGGPFVADPDASRYGPWPR